VKVLPKGAKFNQNYFINGIFPGLYNEKGRISRKEGFPGFSVHMEKTTCPMMTRSLRNLPREPLNELNTYLILQP
jgi:hypothetical protein